MIRERRRAACSGKRVQAGGPSSDNGQHKAPPGKLVSNFAFVKGPKRLSIPFNNHQLCA